MALNKLNVPLQLQRAIMDTLQGASIQITFSNSTTDKINVTRGVRQGDPLSALLFIIAIDPLLQTLTEITYDPESPLTGPHAFADDLDLLANDAETMNKMWSQITKFTEATGMEINMKKSSNARNKTARDHGNTASLEKDHDVIEELPQNAPFKALGVLFTADGDWNHHKRRVRHKFMGILQSCRKKRITDIQYIEVINVMLLSALTYGMSVVPYDEVNITALNDFMHKEVCRRLRIQDNSGWNDWLTLSREKGGLGLYNIRYLHDAQYTNSFMNVIRGPDCPAKMALMKENSEDGFSPTNAEASNSSWKHLTQILEQRNASIHSTKPDRSSEEIREVIRKTRRSKSTYRST